MASQYLFKGLLVEAFDNLARYNMELKSKLEKNPWKTIWVLKILKDIWILESLEKYLGIPLLPIVINSWSQNNALPTTKFVKIYLLRCELWIKTLIQGFLGRAA